MKTEVNTWLEDIFAFLKAELSLLEDELKNRLLTVTKNKVDIYNLLNYFFELRGKRIRPILVFLSSGIIRAERSKISSEDHFVNENKINLAAALELIHNSSLIHDDIVDESFHRRGQYTLNHKFNNKIAVLAGDLLYSHAFLFINNLNFPGITQILSECVELMCQSEINEIISPYSDIDQYIAYSQAKTAALMSACCKCGAIIAGGNEMEVNSLGKFGTNFGISYQLTDDFLDDEQPRNFEVDLLSLAKNYSDRARKNLDNFKESAHKKQLLKIIEYILEKPTLKQAE
jgi:octaprenyl-diphosphate synthase